MYLQRPEIRKYGAWLTWRGRVFFLLKAPVASNISTRALDNVKLRQQYIEQLKHQLGGNIESLYSVTQRTLANAGCAGFRITFSFVLKLISLFLTSLQFSKMAQGLF